MTTPVLFRGKWTTLQAVAATGVAYRRIDYWFRCGLLGEDPACGSGSQRLLTAEQIQRIQFIAIGADAGISHRNVAAALSQLPYDPDRSLLHLCVTDSVCAELRIVPIR